MQLLNIIAWIVVISGLVCAYRNVRLRSRLLSVIFVLGLVVRAAVAASLLAISVFELPVLKELQLGDGFWALAVDARYYFSAAERAAEVGLASIPAGSPSPLYVATLALWLRLVGASLGSAILFNITCYSIVALLIVAMAQSQRASATALAAIASSPALIVFGTQPLKDSFCVLLIAVSITGLHLWSLAFNGRVHRIRYFTVGLLLMSISVYLMAGTRAYFAFFMIFGIASALVGVLMLARSEARGLALASHALLLGLLWAMFVSGGAGYHVYYKSMVRSLLTNPWQAFAVLQKARTGFIEAGGATSVAEGTQSSTGGGELSPTSGSPTTPGASVAAPMKQFLTGAALVFVPISVLRQFGVVTFSGGRGLLLITDLDTLVIDLSLIATFIVLARSRRPLLAPVSIFVFVLVLLTTTPMAYVVTNFGTLFRLRLLAVTPMWMLSAFAVETERPGHAERSYSLGAPLRK